jgi:hypothetical protein
MENFLTGGKLAFLRDEPQSLQFNAVQLAKQRDGFQCDHWGKLMAKTTWLKAGKARVRGFHPAFGVKVEPRHDKLIDKALLNCNITSFG